MKIRLATQNEQTDEELDRVFHALADPTRRALVQKLSNASYTVGELAEPFDMSLNAVSKHLKTLEKANLIERDTKGRTSVCSLNAQPLHNIQGWLQNHTQYWNDILDAFEQHMDQQSTGAPDTQHEKPMTP